MRLIMLAAAVEAVTGLVLIAAPSLVAWLLFGADLPPVGQAASRVAGFALLALGLVCWPAQVQTPITSAVRGLLLYNLLAALFFLYLGVSRELVGVLLWPAFAVHALLWILLARLSLQPDVSKTT
jgi:hypothetical protein